MVLPDFYLASRANVIWQESGIDSLEHCHDKKWFTDFPYQVEYCYNSRGFRDREWPETKQELENAVWVFGDSFTVGIGSPFEHTLVAQLQSKLDRRCINVSLDGASNDWIMRKVERVIDVVRPANIIIQWSFLHRREKPNETLSDEDRRILNLPGNDDIRDVSHFNNIYQQTLTYSNNTNILQLAIPSFMPESVSKKKYQNEWEELRGESWPRFYPPSQDELEKLPADIYQEIDNFGFLPIPPFFEDIPVVNQLDYARDYYHYDLQTATHYATLISAKIK
jgi:hypothetical protein